MTTLKTISPVCPAEFHKGPVMRFADQKPNPDYPKTTPRGFMGKVNHLP